ncbi:hypothetical protein GQ53DRAFT_361268 [Thozetella sp. PMI_491]|nr:hypothetical protein GQ53DRAFT_361268 [Thozetella sp. PMI_491]
MRIVFYLLGAVLCFNVIYVSLANISGGMDIVGDPSVAELAKTLGFDLDNERDICLPYMLYIQGYWPGKEPKSDYLRLFAEVVNYFKGKRLADPILAHLR